MTGFERYKEYLINERKKSLNNEILNKSFKGPKVKGWAKLYKPTEEYKNALEEAYKTDKDLIRITNATPESDEGIFYFNNEAAINDILDSGHKVNKSHIQDFKIKQAMRDIDTETLAQYCNNYSKRVINIITKYFKTKEVFFNIYKYNYVMRGKNMLPLNEYTVGDFIDEYDKAAFNYNCIADLCYSKKHFQEHFLSKLIELRPEYIDTQELINKYRKSCSELLERKNSIANALTQILYEKFSVLNVLELLKQNPYYEHNIDIITKKAYSIYNLNNDILETIPEHYPDLYPNARTIKRHFVLHIGPTNSGKTYSAIEALKNAKSGVYLAPLRLLAYEQFDNLNKQGVYCTLLTGEESIEVPCAEHIASTIEMLNLNVHYEVAVIDEAQMINDDYRGNAWTKAILGVYADEVHICLAPYAKATIIRLINDCGDSYEIHETERQTKLTPEQHKFYFPQNVEKGDALIVFSRNDVHNVAAELNAKKISCSIIYGNLPYDVRHKEAEKFNKGETDVVVATDAIGMGLNMPIKRVVFLKTMKYDGKITRTLLPEEIQQIAGRAGRYGIYDEGFYCAERTTGVNIKQLYEKPIKVMDTAYLPFPESLLSLNVNLSRILKKWNDMKPSFPYRKSNIDREIDLCIYLEKYTDDKYLIYDLITIPFSERDDDLRRIWNKLATDIISNKETNYKEFIWPKFLLSDNPNNVPLDRLEHRYKICDLVYYFANKFWKNKDIIDEITEAKSKISKLTMAALDRKAIKGKMCKQCGHKLPWNYAYKICQDCYKGNYYNEDFDYYNYYF